MSVFIDNNISQISLSRTMHKTSIFWKKKLTTYLVPTLFFSDCHQKQTISFLGLIQFHHTHTLFLLKSRNIMDLVLINILSSTLLKKMVRSLRYYENSILHGSGILHYFWRWGAGDCASDRPWRMSHVHTFQWSFLGVNTSVSVCIVHSLIQRISEARW